jgi:hypothetical protein
MGREIRHAIEVSLSTRFADPETRLGRTEEHVKQVLSGGWEAVKKRPSLGVALAGGLGLAAAQVVGVGEVAVGIAFAYAAYQVLRKGATFDEALERTEKLIR